MLGTILTTMLQAEELIDEEERTGEQFVAAVLR